MNEHHFETIQILNDSYLNLYLYQKFINERKKNQN